LRLEHRAQSLFDGSGDARERRGRSGDGHSGRLGVK
jgi:hypothetical protein